MNSKSVITAAILIILIIQFFMLIQVLVNRGVIPIKRTAVDSIEGVDSNQILVEAPKLFDGVVLIVNFNQPGFYDIIIPILDQLYKPIFEAVVYVGRGEHRWVMSCDSGEGGNYSYVCMKKVMEIYKPRNGFFYTNDDVLVLPWNLLTYDLNMIWWHGLLGYGKLTLRDNIREPLTNYWETFRNARVNGSNLFKNMPEKYLDSQRLYYGNDWIFFGDWADIYYIPNSPTYVNGFVELSELFYKYYIDGKVAVPTILLTIENMSKIVFISGTCSWNNYDGVLLSNMYERYQDSPDFYHTNKMSYMHDRSLSLIKDMWSRKLNKSVLNEKFFISKE